MLPRGSVGFLTIDHDELDHRTKSRHVDVDLLDIARRNVVECHQGPVERDYELGSARKRVPMISRAVSASIEIPSEAAAVISVPCPETLSRELISATSNGCVTPRRTS